MIGRSIGNYKILEILSRTETVEVYKAFDLSLDRNVLIKVLNPHFLNRTDAAEDFRFEAATLAKLRHPGISTLHSLSETEDALFMVLEFNDGETLDKVLRRDGKLSFEKAVPIFVQILDTLENSHKFGIAHGNLKISNIIITDAETAKISGFGTREDVSAQRKVSSENDANADIFNLGAMLFETLTGKSLSDFENDHQVKGRLPEEMRKFLYSVNPFIPEEIKSAVIKAAHPNQAERFQTASAFREILLANSFDESTIKEEISAANKLIADPLPFTRLQPFEITAEPENVAETPTTAAAEKVSDEKNVALYSVNFSRENKNREQKFNSNPVGAIEHDISPAKKSFLKNSQRSRVAIAGVGVLVVLVLQFAWQFSFIQNEKPQIVEIPVQTEQTGKPITVETEPQYEAKINNIIKQSKGAAPVESPQSEIKPSQTVFRKKVPTESRAERLRRVEKALTGI